MRPSTDGSRLWFAGSQGTSAVGTGVLTPPKVTSAQPAFLSPASAGNSTFLPVTPLPSGLAGWEPEGSWWHARLDAQGSSLSFMATMCPVGTTQTCEEQHGSARPR